MSRSKSIVGALLALSMLASQARADVVTEWNALLLDAIRIEDNSPTLAARSLAILHTAIYDSINSVERTHQPYFVDAETPPGTSVEVAAAAAANEVLLNLYPTERARFEEFFSAFLANVPSGPSRENGLALGVRVAHQILEWRASDGVSTTVPYIPNPAPGHWRRTPPFFRPPDSPQCPFVTPFAMVEGNQFRPPGPPPMTSHRYADDLNQVKELGAVNSATRTAEQTEIAKFWSDFSYTVTPPGHWNVIAAIVANQRGNTLAENARLFALLNITMADAGILCWDAKYTYDFWRPVTAIRMADLDDNPDTVPDPEWTSLLNAPPFPEYTSGHSTFSKAGATVLANFYGTDGIGFTVGCDALPGVTRSFTSFTAAADECGISRIYGGIHFLSANRDGKASGAVLADYVTRHFLLPISSLPKLNCIPTATRELRIQLQGIWGQEYVLEASSDLFQWSPISTNAAVRGGTLINAANFLASPMRYFRAFERGSE